MTIIVGYLEPAGKIWMAADSRVSDHDSAFIFPQRAKKLHRCGDWLIGGSSSSRFDEFWEDGSHQWGSVRVLRDEFLTFVKELGVEPHGEANDKGEPPAYGFSLLAARAAELWLISSNASLMQPAWGFAAVGSGQDFAYGAAHALLGTKMPIQALIGNPIERIEKVGEICCHGGEAIVRAAVQAACAFRGDCGGEIDIETVG